MATALSQRLRDGIAAAQAKEFDRARALLQPVVDASPNDALAWFWLAIASPSADAAIPCLRRVLEIDSAHTSAREALVRMLVTQAGGLAAAGSRKEARACATEATELAPDTDTVWLALASVSNDRSERLDALRRAFAINPQPGTRARLHQALLHQAVMVANADRADARTLFHEAACLDPSDTHVWQALVQLADTPEDALGVVRDLLQLAPDHVPGRLLLKKALAADARALEASGDAEAACSRWREAIDLDAGDIDAWLGLAGATADEDEARHAIRTAYDIDPNDDRVTTAMEAIGDVPLDPAAFQAPPDAFARLEQPADVFAPLDAASDPFAQFDLSADPFERFAPAPKPEQAPPPGPATWAAVQPVVAVPPPSAEPPAEEPVVATPVPAGAPIGAAAAAAEPPVVAPEVEPPVVAAPVEPRVEAAPAEAPVVAAPPVAPVVEPPTRPSPAVAVAAAPPPVAPAPVSNGRRTVMVVDDSPTIRKILGLTLERAGYKVVAEPDGESAVERLTQVVPDVILLDIAMPRMDGYEVCKRIRKDPRTAHVPVVMLSGKDALFDKVKGHMAGATEYLTKPFEPPAVLAAVSNACQPAAGAVDG